MQKPEGREYKSNSQLREQQCLEAFHNSMGLSTLSTFAIASTIEAAIPLSERLSKDLYLKKKPGSRSRKRLYSFFVALRLQRVFIMCKARSVFVSTHIAEGGAKKFTVALQVPFDRTQPITLAGQLVNLKPHKCLPSHEASLAKILDIEAEFEICRQMKPDQVLLPLCQACYEAAPEKDIRKISVFLPLADGAVSTLASKPLAPLEKLSVARQMAKVLASFHKKNLLHRDVKLSNFLFIKNEGNYRIFLTDFGVSIRLPPSPRVTTLLGFCGTSYLTAPELCDTPPTENLQKIDSWGLGVCLYLLATEALPPWCETARNISHRRPSDQNQGFRVQLRAEVSSFFAAVQKELQELPAEAAPAVDVLRAAALRLLNPDPAARWTARQASEFLALHETALLKSGVPA